MHVPDEREITEPVDLTLPDGRLGRAAVGWTRTPLHPERHERLGVVVPWSDRLFQYTVKDPARPAVRRLTVDGRLTKISEELRWDYSPGDWMTPWRVHGGAVDVTFHPEHVRRAVTQLGVLASRTHQCFGTWAGRVGDVRVDGVSGWAEDVHQRW